ncbi:DNA-dependent protein kinase catalytic subunit [Phytophthora fragariae]|nr:DNA-dependent protein kinase catalytic subunit [Phytophthora fragariae]
MENQTFQSAVAEKLLQTLLHRADDWAADPSSFDEIEDFCSGVVERSQEWAHQMQETVDMLLSTLRPCLAEVNSNESFANHASTIQSLSFFGSKILSAHVISFPIADKHAETFALVAKITMQYGQCLPDNLALAIVALKAAAACGWRIIDIFVNPAYRQVYGPVHNDVIQFIPTLAVWNRCASDLVSLSLTTDCVVDVLADVLHQVTSFKVYVARSAEWDAFTKTLVANIKQFINNLEAVKADTQRTLSLLRVLRYFLELYQQCSENLVEAVRIGPIPDIRDAIICLLKQRGCSYLVKAEILQMLSLMGPTSVLVADELKAPILESLVAFVFDEFPIVSTDVSRGSKDFDVFHLLFAELLGVVERSNSVAYLKIIYPSLKETDKHIFSSEIKRMLARFSVSLAGNLESGSSSSDRVQLQLGELLDVLLDPALEIAIRKTLLEEVFTPLIECQRGDTLQRFYLMESTTKKSTIIGVLAALISTSGEVTSGGSRIGVFVAFSLVEILYRLLDPEVVRTDINSAFLGHKNGKGREFTMLVCKCASKVVTKAYGDIDELTRLACCAAYSCLLTAVSRTQKQEKFFDQILFQPALWSNVLDQAQNYELPAETEKFATIPLSSLSAVSLQAHDPSLSGNSKAKRNGPAALQFFTASSLSMDADASVMTAPLDIDQVTADYQNVEIELDEFNRHPCMIPLVRVLMQMKSDFGTTWGEKAMPGWMKKLFDVIVDPSTALNVRLFLGKVVLNVPDVFGMYASSWLPAIMETLLDATSAQKVPEFNYLLRDCCNLLLDSWKNIAVSTPKPTADRFINELIRLCPDRNNLIRDNNLVLITELLAIWKDLVSIELSLLTRYIYSDDDDDRRIKSSKQFTALQIVSALLNVGLEDALTSEGEEQTIEDGILLVMKSKTASLYTLAAEVGGLYLQTANHLQGEEFMRKLKDLIISSFNDEDFDRFLALLRNASMHHPEIIDSVMLQRLSFVLSKSVPVDAWALLAAESLTNAAANENVVKDIYAHVQSVLGRFVAHRHAGVQQSTLRAVSCLLNHLAVPEIERLIAKTSEGGLEMLRYYETHEFSECRGLLFNVAMKLYEKDVSPQVKIRLKASLLRGLCDPDDVRRKEAFAYWNRSEFMMKSCSDRLLAVFGSLYSQEFDEKWVLYATNLLVGMSKESDAFERPLFPSALGVGEYTETNIDATWESTTQSMTPLFSVEAEKFSARLGATQQMSNTTYAGSSQVGGSIGSAMQSQLFTSNSQVSASLTPSYSQNLGELEALQRPGRRRFPKRHTMTVSVKTQLNYDKKASKRHFQDQYALQKKQEEARITRERKERQARVSIKRKYRVGEFPDIQISQQDIVDPILALCEVHVETSTLVFGALFSSIVATPQFEQSGNTPELAERLERTLTLSQTSPVYVGCVTSAYFASIVRNPSLCESLVVPATTIGEAGLSSGKHHLSELALEEKLIYSIQHKGLNQGSHEWVASWDLLHKLLSSVHKRNFLIALSMACSTTDESKLALQAQLSGDLPLAIASYKKAILDGEAIQADATRCRWQRFNCLEVLNSWDTLANEITDLANKDSEFLWKQRAPYLEQGVGHYMRSYLGLAEAKRSGSPKVLQELHSFIESATHDSVKHGLVRSRFPVEVCMAYILAGDKNQARVGIEIFYSTFLKTWKQTSSMASTSRLELMQSLSSIVEIDEVLTDFEGDYQRSCKQDMMGFIKAWSRSPPSTGEDGMVLWSQHTMIQNVVSGLLLDYAQVQGTLSDEIRLAVLGIKTNVLLQYANAAISCNILALASKMLKSYRELCNVHQLSKSSVQMVEVFVSHVLKLVDRQEHQSGKDSLNPTSVKLITRYYETATKMFDNVEIMNMMETANTSDQVAMGYLEAKAFASAAAFYSINDVDESLKDEYFSRSLDMFKVSCERINADEGASTAFLRCRLTFIEFLNDLLFKQDMEKLSKLADRKDLVKLLAENVLRGMAAGDRECAHYFPQICDVIAPYPDIVAEFEKYVLAKAPLWTCLQWSAQLMALLNGPIGGTVVLILEKMAEKYPVALFYDFMVTCKSSLDTFKVNLHRLEVLLANPVMEKFVAALRLIHHPEIRLKEGLREIAKLLEDDRTADARHKVELMWKDCFSPDRPLLGAQIGRYNRDWSRKAKRDIEKIMGKDGSKMTAKTVNTAREWIMNHFSVTPGRYGITKDMKAHLGDFAEGLEEFDHSSCSLELPGQYTTYWGPPDPSAHVRILSFDSMLGVLASKQLPKRLTLHCSDEKDYTFLVKGGEDLRLDQRIEQLFGVMNQILNADPGCRDQRLSLTTYDVIPMTQEIGILEWVNGTSTLKGVIESQLQIDDRCTDLRSNKRQKLELFNTTAAKAYASFLLKQRGASFSGKVVSPRSKDVVEQFAKVQAMIPGDLLRRQLLGLGSNFEAFLLVRDHFLKSLAVFNACSYVLGIGDRHLDNFLFDLSNGRVIGIDFGVSFGAGASVLPVPELIPFRYTRQMDFVFQPYDGANLLAQEMQTVFEALHTKRQVVESVMNVFLHEPLLDWQQSTTTHQKALFEATEDDDRSTLQDSDVDMEDVEEPAPTRASRSSKKLSATPAGATAATAWLPDVKIAIARRKLEGVSPGLLLKEELSQNPHLKQHLSKFHALVDAASSSDNGTNEMTAMSSLAQAQELLALATAPDLLGRTFQGWMPWL